MDVAVLADERVSEDPGWSEAKVVEGEGGKDAGVSHVDVDDVVDRVDRVSVSSDDHVQWSLGGGAWHVVRIVIGVVLKQAG